VRQAIGPSSRLIVALDTSDASRLSSLAAAVAPFAGSVKVGLEAYTALGPVAVTTAAESAPVFLDLKLHDIPNTVGGAARAAADLGVAMLTVHASGGAAMIAAAVDAAPDVAVLAVTVLTSLDPQTLESVGQPPADQQVPRLARIAIAAGARGIVCAPREAALVRDAVGPGPMIIVPGIRPAGADTHDQVRVATPAQALAAGATHLVVGRPITSADDPGAAAAAILREVL
jgi:orotidine-5'-phosphate decarboxylase